MAVANVTDKQAASDLEEIRTKTKKTERDDELATPDPFQLQQFNALKGQLDSFERKFANAPAYEDVEQLKDYVFFAARHTRLRETGP